MSKRGRLAKYVVRLNSDERVQLGDDPDRARRCVSTAQGTDIAQGGCVLRKPWLGDDARIAEALETSLSTVFRTRHRFVQEGLEASLTRRKQSTPPRPRICDGEAEAKLIAPACSEPPEGHARWSLRLLKTRARGTL